MKPGEVSMVRFVRDLAAALAIVAVTTHVRRLLTPVLGSAYPYELFIPAIILSAWLGGVWVGILAALAGTVGAVWVILPVRGLFPSRPDQQFEMIAFLITGTFVAWVAALQRDARRAAQESAHVAWERHNRLRKSTAMRVEAEMATRQRAAEVEALNRRLRATMGETHHRVKNNLQLVAAMLDLAVMECEAVPANEIDALAGRVRAMARVHEQLTGDTWQKDGTARIDVAALLQPLVDRLAEIHPDVAIRLDADALTVSQRHATVIGLVVNELVWNASKSGAKKIDVALSANPESAVIDVSDDGPGGATLPDVTSPSGHGLSIVSELVHADLSGSLSVHSGSSGTRIRADLGRGVLTARRDRSAPVAAIA